jgi:3-deoxy-D-manno-octulosonic acid (KDO) 8-phosphate synthase
MAFDTAAAIRELCLELNIPLVFKSSFDKANRSSLHSARGVGMEKGLTVLQEIKDKLGLPVLTDVHESAQCAPVAEVVDVLQIRAFLSARPISCSLPPHRQSSQYQKRAIYGSLGYAQCHHQNGRSRQ